MYRSRKARNWQLSELVARGLGRAENESSAGSGSICPWTHFSPSCRRVWRDRLGPVRTS